MNFKKLFPTVEEEARVEDQLRFGVLIAFVIGIFITILVWLGKAAYDVGLVTTLERIGFIVATIAVVTVSGFLFAVLLNILGYIGFKKL